MVPVALDGPDVKLLRGLPGEHEDLRVVPSAGCMFSAWKPSVEELAMRNEGSALWLVIKHGDVNKHPAVTMIVGSRRGVVPPGKHDWKEGELDMVRYTWLGLKLRILGRFLLSL